MDLYTTRTTCRACDGPFLTTILDMGTPVLSDFVAQDAPDPERVPLDFVLCEDCGLAQLRHTTSPDVLYRKYWYRSSVNELMRAELADIVQKASLLYGGVSKSSTVLDIGANDGYLLGCYEGPQAPMRIAYEPALNLNAVLRPRTSILVPDLFPNAVEQIAAYRHEVGIITSVAVFNHVDAPRPFVAAIDHLLARDGVWVMQVQDLAEQVRSMAYDNIGHEHVTYYSAATFETLLAEHDLHVVSTERRAINGGSLRFYIRRRHHPRWQSADTQRIAESWLDREALQRFAARIDSHKAQLVGTIDHFLDHGAIVDLYAASTKSSTLLQHCGIDHRRIRQAVERSEDKFGLETSGTRIPIVSEVKWREDPSDVVLMGAWQFRDAFVRRERAYLEQGGMFLCPLPQTELISMHRAVTI